MKIAILNLLMLLTILTSCGPKLEEKKRTPVEVPNGPTFQEAIITDFADDAFAQENTVRHDTTENLLKQTEFILDISANKASSVWQNRALQNYQDVEKNLLSQKIDYSNSTYLDLVYEQIHDDVNSSVKQVDKEIAGDTDKIVAMIRKEQNATLKMNPVSTLSEKLQLTQKFLNTLTANVKKMDVLPEFKESFASELKKQSQKLLNDATAFESALSQAETLSAGLKTITAFIEKNATQLEANDRASLDLGLQLAEVLDHLEDSKSGLQALALVWSLLNESQRLEYFKPANESLYKFLSERSADDIRCLTEKNCKGVKNFLVLNIGVYPAIEKFGLKAIADTINQKGVQFLIQKVNQVAYASLQKIGETITEQVLASVKEKRSDLGKFKNNLRDHLSDGLSDAFSTENIKSPRLFLIDKQKVTLSFESQTNYIRNKIKILPILSLQNKKANTIQLQFEIIEGLASLPLFSKTVTGSAKTMQNDLAPLILNPEARQYLQSVGSNNDEINLNEQSDLLLTASTALNELADWKSTSFDTGLTEIKAEKILTQFKSDSLDKSFFAKSDLMSIILSISSQTLKLMQSDFSAIVLVNNENQILPIQKIDDGPIALAAATDFKANVRIPIVKAADLSRFLIAMMQFYSSTEGIEQTHSEFLKKVPEGKVSLLEELLAARQSIRLLIIATSNFLSSQLIQSNGLVSESILLNDHLSPSEKYGLLDQTRAVEALVQAYEQTKLDVYLWSAKNIYRSMNRLLYSTKIKFYQQNSENQIQSGVDAVQILESYKNLLKLKPYLDQNEQLQFENIFQAWLKS